MGDFTLAGQRKEVSKHDYEDHEERRTHKPTNKKQTKKGWKKDEQKRLFTNQIGALVAKEGCALFFFLLSFVGLC
jgi:hypothetical protein